MALRPFKPIKKAAGAVWKDNWVPYWGWVKLASGSFLLLLEGIAQVVNNGQVQDAISKLDIDPRVALGIALFGAITLLAIPHGED